MAGRAKNGTKPVARAPARKASDIAKAQTKVLNWFAEHGRAFPWRTNRDPYKTMVAEVMLQQTQTGRVGPTYDAFLQHFPTITSLAHAPAMDVIGAWRGLGYNKRAVNLQRAAQAIEHDLFGVVPHDPRVLRTLPGIGDYSANAIACFAFDAQVPVVDVNVQRVLGRVALAKDDSPRIEQLARTWLPAGRAYEWNQALMDIGAMLCRHDKPLCTQCPFKTACVFHARGNHRKPSAARPVKEPFAGSRRQRRGGIVDTLRRAASQGVTLTTLAKAIHPEGDRDLGWLVELLEGLERDGLVAMTPGARRGSPRGVVRLPR